MNPQRPRRDFLGRLAAFGADVYAECRSVAATRGSGPLALPEYALAQNYRSLKQSSIDRTGGNADRW